MAITKDDVARQFGRQSHEYAVSKGHASGSDLAILLDMLQAQSDMRVLDVATGAGHTAAAVSPQVSAVVATDLTPEMVEETKQLFARKALSNVSAQVMDVENLHFGDGAFDAVTCRIAPHHFIDIARACREIGRVLKSGGIFALEDNIAPANKTLDRFINTVEVLRDPTHIRSYTVGEWKSLLWSAGLYVVKSVRYHKTHDVADWIKRSGISDEDVARVYDWFNRAPQSARKHFKIQYKDGVATSFTDDKVILRAIKR